MKTTTETEERHQARLTAVLAAHTVEEARQFLDMLDLVPREEPRRPGTVRAITKGSRHSRKPFPDGNVRELGDGGTITVGPHGNPPGPTVIAAAERYYRFRARRTGPAVLTPGMRRPEDDVIAVTVGHYVVMEFPGGVRVRQRLAPNPCAHPAFKLAGGVDE